MEFDKLKTEIKKIESVTARADDDNYFEVVVKKACLGEIAQLLKGVFGEPAWPSSNKLSKETEKIVKDFGGLRPGQTLYALNEEGHSVFAMLWPWQDGERITIKISKISG